MSKTLQPTRETETDRQTDRDTDRQTHTYTLTGRVREGETEADTHIPREGRGREQITVNSRVASQGEAVGGTGGKGGGIFKGNTQTKAQAPSLSCYLLCTTGTTSDN